MNLKRTVNLVTPLLLLTFMQLSEARTIEHDMPGGVYRVLMQPGEAVPNYVAYLSLMEEIYSDAGGETAIEQVQARLDIDETEARAFVQQTLHQYRQMLAQNRKVTERLLCNNVRDRLPVAAMFEVMDSLEDIKETNLRRHYASFAGRNAVDPRLQDWLDDLKQSSAHHKYNHQALFRHTGKDPQHVISHACQRLSMLAPISNSGH